MLVWDENTDTDSLGESWKKAAGKMLDSVKTQVAEFLAAVNPEQQWTVKQVVGQTNGNER